MTERKQDTGPGQDTEPGQDTDPDTRIWVVDRVESTVAVLIADDDERQVAVPLTRLPHGIGAGSVLRVPEADGEPQWEAASADEELRRERLREAESTLERLRRRDPGGNIVL